MFFSVEYPNRLASEEGGVGEGAVSERWAGAQALSKRIAILRRVIRPRWLGSRKVCFRQVCFRLACPRRIYCRAVWARRVRPKWGEGAHGRLTPWGAVRLNAVTGELADEVIGEIAGGGVELFSMALS